MRQLPCTGRDLLGPSGTQADSHHQNKGPEQHQEDREAVIAGPPCVFVEPGALEAGMDGAKGRAAPVKEKQEHEHRRVATPHQQSLTEEQEADTEQDEVNVRAPDCCENKPGRQHCQPCARVAPVPLDHARDNSEARAVPPDDAMYTSIHRSANLSMPNRSSDSRAAFPCEAASVG